MKITITEDIPEVDGDPLHWQEEFKFTFNTLKSIIDYRDHVNFDRETKRLTIRVSDDQIMEFESVELVGMGSGGFAIKALTVVPSGTMSAPISRIICITFE